MLSFFISVGESSGDLHASELINKLRESTAHDTVFSGLGGDEMIRSGFKKLYHIRETSATGYAEVIKKYNFFKKILNEASEFILKSQPSAVILVDYPGFNIRLASKIRPHYKGKIIYYISPQLWAWREGRVRKIKDSVDKMLVIFPFEAGFYLSYGLNAVYVGHPLVNRLKNIEHLVKNPPSDTKIITLMPGSREEEIRNHLPVLSETIKALLEFYKLKVYIIKPEHINKNLYDDFQKVTDTEIISKDKYNYLSLSDAVMAKAGTSTLECALIGVPHLIFYKTMFLNYILLKPQAKIQNMGIVNIISGKNIVREFIQKDFTPDNLKNETLKLLNDHEYVNRMKEGFLKVKEILGITDASKNAAFEILKMVE